MYLKCKKKITKQKWYLYSITSFNHLLKFLVSEENDVQQSLGIYLNVSLYKFEITVALLIKQFSITNSHRFTKET